MTTQEALGKLAGVLSKQLHPADRSCNSLLMFRQPFT